MNPDRNDGVNGGQAEILDREAALGRTYDIMDRFYPFTDAIPTSLESWDVSMGRIPMITWGAPSDTIELASGVHDVWLTQQADRLAAFGSPIFLRFFHEMDGGYRQTYVHSSQDFIAAWRHVHDLFVQRGATNVVWIWCPTSWSFVTGSPWPPNYYPGDAYVDWIASDGYSWFPAPGTKWRTWTQIFQPFYDWASTANKPIMIAEYGVQEDPAIPGRKASWISDAQQVLQTQFPLIQAVLYFDIQMTKNGFTYAWPVDSSQGSLAAFAAMGADPYFSPPHGAPDTTPPTTPGTPQGSSNSPTSIDLTWAASTDDLSTTLMYLVNRDGGQVGSVSSASTTAVGFTDTGLTPGSVHSYTVVAVDGWGNPSGQSDPSSPITVQSGPAAIFADDFSSGTLSGWTGTTRLTVDGTMGGAAPPSVRAQVSAQSAWGYKLLGSTYPTICMSARINATSLGSAALVLLKLRTAANGAIARVSANASGQLLVRSDVSGTQRSSGVSVGSGWHLIELCGTVGTATTWSLYRDGIAIVNAWSANTGTVPVGRIDIGDSSAKTFTVNWDDVVVDQTPG